MYIDDFTKMLLKLEPPSILGVAVMLGVKIDGEDGEAILCNILNAYEGLNRKKRKTLIWLLRKATQSDHKDQFWSMVYKIGKNGLHFRAGTKSENGFGQTDSSFSQNAPAQDVNQAQTEAQNAE